MKAIPYDECMESQMITMMTASRFQMMILSGVGKRVTTAKVMKGS